MIACPALDELRQFLDGELSDERRESTARHIDDCPACQQRLETISEEEDAAPWRLTERDFEAIQTTSSLDRRTLQTQKEKILATLEEGDVPTTTCAVSHFRRLHEHARGGLSEVYVFREEALARDVALKVLREDCAMSPELRRRFARECRITSELDHPGVPPVFGVGRLDDGRDFFTMRFVGGETLARRIADFYARPSSRASRIDARFRDLLSAFRTVCQTVDHAHAQGVVHRDLKPQNIQVDGHETVVLDWGLAKKLAELEEPPSLAIGDFDQGGTHVDQRIGTPAYMAPEQAAGGGADLDQRTDVYGLGAILFEMLTGGPPHPFSNQQPLDSQSNGKSDEATHRQRMAGHYQRIAQDPPPIPSEHAARRIPGELQSICRRAMAHDPAARYQTAAEVAEEIDRWLAGQPVAAHQYGLMERGSLWIAGHRAAAAAAVLVLLLVTIVASISTVLVTAARLETRRTALASQHARVIASADLAAEMLAAEIDLRWRILESEAADPKLSSLLEAAEDEEHRQDALTALRKWSDGRFAEHSDATRATSWFVVDRRGTLLARNPESSTSGEALGGDFRYRDYFHGRGRDVAPTEAADFPPLAAPHRSAVFQSRITGTHMVAFSVPIWPAADQDEQQAAPIGVLGMTIEMGRFDSLQRGAAQGQVLALADLRENVCAGQPARGLILHHPSFVPSGDVSAAAAVPPLITLSPDRTTALLRLREERLAQEQQLQQRSWRERLAAPRPASPDRLETEYLDPVGGAYGGRWAAGFSPVLIKGRPASRRDTGLIVIVQERGE